VYERNGEGLHYYKDPADESEYIYSQYEAFNTHKTFPCFNQPNLKACLDLLVFAKDKQHIVTATHHGDVMRTRTGACIEAMKEFEVGDEIYARFQNEAEV